MCDKENIPRDVAHTTTEVQPGTESHADPRVGPIPSMSKLHDSPVVSVQSIRKLSADALEPLSPKFKAGILGATGSVGQTLIALLSDHPWIEIEALGASERSSNMKYSEACDWRMDKPLNDDISQMHVVDVVKDKRQFIEGCDLIFSALTPNVSKMLESELAAAGLPVFTNSAPHRTDLDVPIVIPAVNPEHLALVKTQKTYKDGGGFICANANCAATGLCVALRPLMSHFNIESVIATTLQAVSGAGYPGISWWDIHDNVIPNINGEEAKIEFEPRKILGSLAKGPGGPDDIYIEHAKLKLSAMCHRVPVLNGHTVSMSIKFGTPYAGPNLKSHVQQIYQKYQQSLPYEICNLPSMPRQLVKVMDNDDFPQPRLHANEGKGMTVSVGRIRQCNIFDLKLTCLAHNTVIGAAGGSALNAELAIVTGLLR